MEVKIIYKDYMSSNGQTVKDGVHVNIEGVEMKVTDSVFEYLKWAGDGIITLNNKEIKDCQTLWSVARVMKALADAKQK